MPRLTTSKDTARDSQLNTHVATKRIDGTLGHERRRRYPIEDLKENRDSGLKDKPCQKMVEMW